MNDQYTHNIVLLIIKFIYIYIIFYFFLIDSLKLLENQQKCMSKKKKLHYIYIIYLLI